MLKVILSFDDGRKDNYRVAKEVLLPMGIPATFNITTGYILNDIDDKDKPGPHKPMSLNELKELSEYALFEIAGHGYRHDNEVDNLVQGVKRLRELLPDKEIVGIASPRSQFELSKLKDAEQIFKKNNICYLRISNDYSKMSKWKIVVRRINRIFHIPAIYRWVNQDSLVDDCDFLLHSVPVIRDNRLKEITKLIDVMAEKYKKQDKSCVLMFHSILKPGEEYYEDLFSWDYDIFYQLCRYLLSKSREDMISIERTTNLFEKNCHNEVQ